ncbi:MAG: drug/metabolite transporter, family [Pseudonocardiales bacterium]|jgi:DME family drug/metabolite transporter|nr:drug/metabolite transporter, family [Pseudonocardiales bacterium]
MIRVRLARIVRLSRFRDHLPPSLERSLMPFLVLAGVLWGTGGLLGTLFGTAADLSPLAVACYRLAVGGALICGWLLLTGRRVPPRRDAWLRVVATGALAALFQGCYFAAVARTSVSVATLVAIASAPVVVLLVDAVRGRRPGRRTLAGTVLALAGLALLVEVPGGGGVTGALFAALAGAGFAVMSLLAERPVAGLDAPTTTGAGFLLGGLLLAPGAATAGLAFTPTPTALALLLAFGVVPTAVAYTVYFRGVAAASAGVGAVLALLEPLTAAGLAAVVFGDRLGPVGTVGAVVLGVALLLVALPERVRSSYRRSA